jgi:hypothetical protein
LPTAFAFHFRLRSATGSNFSQVAPLTPAKMRREMQLMRNGLFIRCSTLRNGTRGVYSSSSDSIVIVRRFQSFQFVEFSDPRPSNFWVFLTVNLSFIIPSFYFPAILILIFPVPAPNCALISRNSSAPFTFFERVSEFLFFSFPFSFLIG